MTTDTIRQLAHRLRTASLTLATPCTCGKPGGCTIADHVHRTTATLATLGPRAATTEPGRTSTLSRPPTSLGQPDPAHSELQQLLTNAGTALDHLEAFIQQWRPDRTTDTPDENDWCAHHLEHLGTCEPRYRGDLCRRCYDLNRTINALPSHEILEAWHHGRKVTEQMVAAARPKRPRRKRRR